MKKIIILLLLFISSMLNAQNADAVFSNANTLYKEGKYNEAIKLYEEIANQDKVSSELYYNLGNAYYKLNKVAPSIYYYEKALQLNPLNEDAQNNLIFAKRLTLDRIEELPKSVFQKFNENYLQKLTYNGWAIVAVIFSFLAGILFLLFYFAIEPSKKRLYFVTSMLSFLLLIITLSITFTQYNDAQKNIHAIIFSEEVTVKNAPTPNSEEVFTLHEGTKVKVLDSVDDWKKIRLTDGKIGWMKANLLKVI